MSDLSSSTSSRSTPLGRQWSFLLVVGLLAALLLPLSQTADAAVSPSSAGMENDDFSGFSDTSTSSGDLNTTTERAATGSRSAHATYDGSGSNGYARGQTDVSWDPGDEVWYSMSVFLPNGFKDRQRGAVDLIRWDNWSDAPDNADHGGLAVSSRGELVLIKEQLSSQPYTVVLGPYEIPEGRWVHLEVRQRFSSSNGDAVNEIWVDGSQVGANSEANSYGNTITRLRAGLVSIDSGSQTTSLELWFDDATIATSQVGASGGSPAPTEDVEATDDVSDEGSDQSDDGHDENEGGHDENEDGHDENEGGRDGNEDGHDENEGGHDDDRRFRDVAPTSTHADNILTVTDAHIARGCGQGDDFCPQTSVTREQIATMLTNALDLPVPDEHHFHDVRGVHADGINALAAADLTEGCASRNFCPSEPLSRQQMATMIARAVDLPHADSAGFRDVKGPHTDSIDALAAAGVTKGCDADGDNYCPVAALSRAQMATVLVNAFELDGDEDDH